MLSPDELIESGFASLRNAQPNQRTTELLVRARRQETRAKIVKTIAASASCLVFIGVLAVALQPTSALAALRESARLTAAEPIIHVRFDREDVLSNPTTPPWPSRPALDIWRFKDHYVRKEGHSLSHVFKTGKILSYDDRFAFGARARYDVAEDHFWDFDGSIAIELASHKEPPSVSQSGGLTDYAWQDTDGMRNKMTTHIFVDPASKLVKSSTHQTLSASGDKSNDRITVDYPGPQEAKAPGFPGGLRFRTEKEVLSDFRHRVSAPEQTKTLAGIKATLYGVVVYANVPDGLGVDVITTGGTGPDFGSGHEPKIIGVKLLDAKRSSWFPPFTSREHTKFGDIRSIGGRKVVVNQSDDLLAKLPKKITVKVPVWKGESHEFVGYVTFTTSKIFANPAGGQWKFYD